MPQLAQDSTGAIVKYVSNYFDDPSEMLYFEQGTLFGIHIRFVHRDDAIAAQKWILDHLHYGPRVHSVVDVMAKSQFNAIHVRGRIIRRGNFLWIIGSGLYRVSTVAQMYHYMLPLMRNIGIILIHLKSKDKSWFLLVTFMTCCNSMMFLMMPLRMLLVCMNSCCVRRPTSLL